MAAPIYFRAARICYKRFASFRLCFEVSHCTNGVKRAIKYGPLFAALFTKPTEETKVKLEEPCPSTLTWEYKIKSSTNATAEHACTLLTQAALALKDTNKKYVETVFALVILMEYRLQVLGNQAEEERTWDLILEARKSVSELKRKKWLLEMTVSSAQNLVNTSAELAFFIGEELVGGVAGERLTKVELFLRGCQEEGEQAETKLRDIEAKTIKVEGKYAEELEKAGKLDELAEKVAESTESSTAECAETLSADLTETNPDEEVSDNVQTIYEVFHGPYKETVQSGVVGSNDSELAGNSSEVDTNVDVGTDLPEISDKFSGNQKPDMAEDIIN